MAFPDAYFSADPALLDHDRVFEWISVRSYWAKGRTRAKLESALKASRVYGMYESGTDTQLAFARVVTDGATFAWLCDVYVDDDARGRHLGIRLIDGVMAELTPLGLSRIALATGDAHSLYKKFGFASLPNPEMWMSIQPDRKPL